MNKKHKKFYRARNFQFLKVPKSMKNMIGEMAKKLPQYLYINEQYHLKRLTGIYLDKYKVKSKVERDDLMVKEIEIYVDAINFGYANFISAGGNYNPFKVVQGEKQVSCQICSSVKLSPLTDKEDENRYLCNNCQAVHIPENGETKVFFTENKLIKDDSKNSVNTK